MSDMSRRKTCFVIQGFGEKTDLATGRVLDLNASYQVIKEAVEAAGLECVRADEIVHSGTIDLPMYQRLYDADLVIADLSTSNINAAYELGVRYGVKPQATIVIAEQQFKYPFDVSHISIFSYEHLGKDIGRKEYLRVKDELAARIRTIIAQNTPDSPVYTYLQLAPPTLQLAPPTPAGLRSAAEGPLAADPREQSAKAILEQALEARDKDNFVTAAALFEVVRGMRPNDPFVVQQHALATYKSKAPDPMSALHKARDILAGLDPDVTNDPETLGLWGAVHKRLWDLTTERARLDTAIASYERGFYLKQDYYNGINLAFLLNERAKLHQKGGDRAEAVTDFVLARRVRAEVLRLCETAMDAAVKPAEKYWVAATMWEAAVGLGDAGAEQHWHLQAAAIAPAGWMTETTGKQIDRLKALLADSPVARM